MLGTNDAIGAVSSVNTNAFMTPNITWLTSFKRRQPEDRAAGPEDRAFPAAGSPAAAPRALRDM